MANVFSGILTVLSLIFLSTFFPSLAPAATISVTETSDGFDGETCTLRNAIQSVNTAGDFGGCTNSSPDGYGTNDTINLIAATYVLSRDGNNENDNVYGDLDIHVSVILNGAGAEQTAISASGFELVTDRVAHVVEPPAPEGGLTPIITVTFQDLTIRDGNYSDNGGGLAIEFSGSLVNLNRVTVTENFTGEDGGGIANFNGVLRMDSSLINDNVGDSDAGALDIDTEAYAIITNSTLDNNRSFDDGGAVYSFGTLVLINSTVSRNQAVDEDAPAIVGAGGVQGDGGGINISDGLFLALNSTISNNTAGFQGGGILVESIDAAGTNPLEEFQFILLNTTVAENTVLDADGFGGGICMECAITPGGGVASPFTLLNSLVFGNDSANSPDCGGDFVSGGFNLIGNIEACNGFTASGDQTGVADAGLGPLQNNGGPTETHALLEGSPAIDTANNVDGCQGIDIDALFSEGLVTVPLTEDQRGLTRPVAVLDPAVAVCDIGAYEFQIAQPTPTPTATPTATPVPPFNGFIEGSGCSLGGASPASMAGMVWSVLALGVFYFGKRKSLPRD